MITNITFILTKLLLVFVIEDSNIMINTDVSILMVTAMTTFFTSYIEVSEWSSEITFLN